MHTEKTERLFQEFPDLFKREQLINGFECQDGWFELIHGLAGLIREHQSQVSKLKKFEVVQVKQKMGALRFYIQGGDEVIQKLIQEVEKKSKSICELDGELATGLYVCAPRWYRYLCEKCAILHGCMTNEDYLREKNKVAPVHETNSFI